MMWLYHGPWGWGDWIGMTLAMILFWGLVIVGIVALGRYVNTPRTEATAAPDPKQLLAECYARGEIDDDEYARRKAMLENDPSGPQRKAG